MKMRMQTHSLLVLWLYAVLHNVLTKEHTARTSAGRRNVLLHEAVRKLLGFRTSPTSKSKQLLPNPLEEEKPPKYILDLYDKYIHSTVDRNKLGNTVRSIHAEIGQVNGEAMFIFNLSSISQTEKVLSAEVHLHKRKSKPWHRQTDIDVLLFEVAPHYLSEIGKITMRNSAHGWQWYSVTNAVLSCVATGRFLPHLLALTFKAEKGDGKVRTVALKKFVRHHSMPFLIVYSNETENVNLDQLDKLAEKIKLQNMAKHSTNSLDNTFVKSRSSTGNARRTSSTGNARRTRRTSSTGNARRTDPELRAKRSIFTNEIPEDPADYEKFHYRFNIPQTHPGILQARKESRTRISDSQLIPYPAEKRKRKRKHRRRNRKKGRKNSKRLKFPDEWDDIRENLATLNNNPSDLCGKRKLIVDFADIGWGEWIISPKSFEAHFCAGSCPFPLTKRLRPSNHATIQSIVHAIGIYSNVPAPCCIPDVMSSVTLLYFDEDRNVVLKNYPGMTVQSCACR